MYRVINSIPEDEFDDVFCMSKLHEDLVDHSIVGDIGKFIWISASNHRTGPRVKFWGGTNETLDSKKMSVCRV